MPAHTHEPTKQTNDTVEAMVSYGVSHESIARVLGISEAVLRECYAVILETAAAKANSLVAQSLFNKATKGEGSSAVAAAIFWLKTRAGWKETGVHELTGANGGAVIVQISREDALL